MVRVCVVLVALSLLALVSGQHHSTGKWVRKIPLGPYFPSPRFFHTQASAGNSAIIFGGTNGVSQFRDLFEYRVQQNTVYLLDTGSGPSARSGACAQLWAPIVLDIQNTDGTNQTIVVRNATYVVFGGFNGKSYLNDLWMFNLGTGVWTQGSFSNTPAARAYHTCATTGAPGEEELAVFGGYNGAYLGDFIVLNTAQGAWFNPPNNAPLGLGPSPRAYIQGINQGDDLFFYGGFDGSNCLSDTWVFNSVLSSWFSIPSPDTPPPLAAYAGIHMEGGGYDTFGGFANCQTSTDQLYSLSHNSPDWINVPPGGLTPPPRSGVVGTRHGNDALIYAGADGFFGNGTLKLTKVYDDVWVYVL